MPTKFSKPLWLHVSRQDKLMFTKHLATMIKAGVSILDALATLRDQTSSASFKYILHQVYTKVENGKSLSAALSQYPKVFDPFYIGLLTISEQAGTLEENLAFLSLQLTKDSVLRSKITSALLYPGLVLSATMGMAGFIAFGVLPQLSDFFTRMDVDLPLTTKILLFISDAVKNYGVAMVGGMIAFLITFSILIQQRQVKLLWHAFLLKIPILGLLLKTAQISRFTRNLGTLLHSGVPVLTAIESTAETISNMRIKQDLYQLAKAVEKGQPIGQTLLETYPKLFPALTSRMISVGEKTGTLDETLLYLADFYDEEIDGIAKNMTTLLEPMLLLTIGLMVGFVALAIISPIYELTGSIQR